MAYQDIDFGASNNIFDLFLAQYPGPPGDFTDAIDNS